MSNLLIGVVLDVFIDIHNGGDQNLLGALKENRDLKAQIQSLKKEIMERTKTWKKQKAISPGSAKKWVEHLSRGE